MNGISLSPEWDKRINSYSYANKGFRGLHLANVYVHIQPSAEQERLEVANYEGHLDIQLCFNKADDKQIITTLHTLCATKIVVLILLSGVDFRDEVVGKQLIDVIRNNRHLVNLRLFSCRMSPGISVYFADFLANSKLNILYVSDTNLHPEGYVALAKALPNTRLIELSLVVYTMKHLMGNLVLAANTTGLCVNDLSQICDGVRQTKTLTGLSLESGLEVPARAISDMIAYSNLKHFEYFALGLKNSELVIIGEGIRKNLHFECLRVEHSCRLTNKGFRRFMDEVGHHRSFKRLDVYYLDLNDGVDYDSWGEDAWVDNHSDKWTKLLKLNHTPRVNRMVILVLAIQKNKLGLSENMLRLLNGYM